MRRLIAAATMTMAMGCGGGGASTTPTPATAAISVTANPNPIVGQVCTGCGAQTTDREAVTQLTVQETGGVSATVVTIAMTLRENGTNAVIASGEFDTAAVTQLAGASRIAANGSLV